MYVSYLFYCNRDVYPATNVCDTYKGVKVSYSTGGSTEDKLE